MTNDFTDQDDDFGALLEASFQKKRRRFAVGEKVRATVVNVGPELISLDLGDGQDGLIEIKQLGEAGNRPELREGEVLDAFILRFENRVAELGLKLGRGGASTAQLEEAHRSGLPVEGLVSEVNKGGYVVEVGATRAFCPLGAMDVRRIEDPSVMIGQKLLFRVTEMKGPRDVVLSRRALLEEENAKRAAETRERLEVGANLSGVVTNVRDFGAFVDFGGIEGLVPAGEMGHGRVHPPSFVSVGQRVDVQVMAMEAGKDGSRERITLSMKSLLDDPFRPTVQALAVGTIVAGTVTRVQPFGAFVEIVPGVEGLIHVSAFGRRVQTPSDVVKPGQEVAVRVEGVDEDARRISLVYADQEELANAAQGTVPAESTVNTAQVVQGTVPPASTHGPRVLRLPAPRVEVDVEPAEVTPAVARPALVQIRIGDVFDVTVDKVESYGAFVRWPTGRGLVPGREMGLPRGADLRRQCAVGTAFRAAVIEVREDGKLTLSKIAVERAEERAETDAYMRQHGSPSGGGMGTLGDLLKSQEET